MLQIPLLNRQSRSRSMEAQPGAENSKRIFPLRLDLQIIDTGRVLSMQLADCLLVGRDSTPAPDIDMTELDGVQYGISRMHAAFLYDGHTLSVEDLNSRNGTRINGFRVEGGKPYPLHNGDELELGHMRLLIQLVRGAA
jgi:pSer/pThr/pTyr-binding forkhead associated (FHA) protein